MRDRHLAAQRLAARLEIDGIGETFLRLGARLAGKAETIRRASQQAGIVLARDGFTTGAGIARRLQGGQLDVGIDGRRHQNRLRPRLPSLQSAARTHGGDAEIELRVALGRILVKDRERGERRLRLERIALAGRGYFRRLVGQGEVVLGLRIARDGRRRRVGRIGRCFAAGPGGRCRVALVDAPSGRGATAGAGARAGVRRIDRLHLRRLSGWLELGAGSGNGMRSPLSRRLTVGYSICSAARAIGGASTDHVFTLSERGSKLTGWAPYGSGIAVPIGRTKLNVAT